MERGPVRVAVMADTHGVLLPDVEKILETCDVIVHAGDFDTQMLYMKLSGRQPLYAVRGNNDRGWSGGLAGIKRFEIGGVKMVMAHQRTDIPVALGNAQVVIFGHSHMYQQQEIAGRLWLNPGSCGYKRRHTSSFHGCYDHRRRKIYSRDDLAGKRLWYSKSSDRPD